MLLRPLYVTKAFNFAWAAVADITNKLASDTYNSFVAIGHVLYYGRELIAWDPNEQYLDELEDQLGKRLPVSVAELDQFIAKEITRFLTEIPDQAERDRFMETWYQARHNDADPYEDLETNAESQRRVLRSLALLENKWPRGGEAGSSEEIYFVTSRAFQGTDFTFNRSNDLSYGRCVVTSRVRRFPNPLTFLPYRGVRQLMQLNCEITSAMTTMPGKNNENLLVGNLKDAKWMNDTSFTKLVLFIHGYNQSFKQAIECCYKLREKLNLNDRNVRFAVFSWPCKGDTGFFTHNKGYLRDLTKIGMPWYYIGDLAANEGSEAFIPRFIDDLASKAPNLREIHMIGHSMGCRLLLRSLTDINPESVALVRSVTFAAPDADRQMFEMVLPTTLQSFRDKQTHLQVPECTFVLLLNDCDLALGISATIHGYPRAGRVKGRYPAVQQAPLFVVDSSTSDNWDEPRYMDDYAVLRHFDFVNMNKCVEVIARTITLDRPQLAQYLQQNFTQTGDAYTLRA